MMLIQLLQFVLLVIITYGMNYPPTWITNSMVQAKNNKVISSLTTSNVTPTYTFTFLSPFSGIPNLGYGIKQYKGNDYFQPQKFQVNRTSLNTSTFSVAIQIVGSTFINVLCVSFIGIDPTFPHHLNSFDNVPVNYGSTLQNITVQDAINTLYYSNTINYTQQVGGSTIYDKFLTPFSRNKILLFMTSMFIIGNNQPDANIFSGPLNPLSLTVDVNVIQIDQYKIDISLRINVKIQKLHYSIIVFDQQDVQSTGKYRLVYERINFTSAGGFIPVPYQFKNNFIMGFTNFSSIRTKCTIHFQWDFQIVSGVQGVLMPVSVGLSTVGTVIDNIGFTMFYMKTWICPDQTVFDIAQDLCVGCPIHNCKNCLNIKMCKDCQEGYTANPMTGQCDISTPIVKLQCNGFIITVPKQLYSGTVNVSISNPLLTITNTEETQTSLKIYTSYTQDFLNQTFILVVTSNNQFQVNYSQIVPSVLYSSQECLINKNISNLLIVVSLFSYLTLLISLISFKIVGIQLFGVLQLAYFALAGHSYFDLYLAPLTEFKLFNGLNLQFISDNATVPDKITALNLSSLFLNNFNIMFIVVALVVLTGFILYIVNKKFTVSEKVKKVSQLLLYQGLITLIMFNIFNFSFSSGLQWKYGQQQPSAWAQNLVIVICFIGITATVIVMEFVSKNTSYGQFKLKFKNNWVCKIYILLSLIMRMCIGFYLSTKNDYEYGTIFILAFSLLFIMYTIINLPFKSALQNYRACLCQVTQLITLLATNYYRTMKSNTPLQIKAHLHSLALLQIIMIVLCVFMSMGVLAYEVYKIILKYKKQKAIKPDIKKNQITEQSIEVLNNN